MMRLHLLKEENWCQHELLELEFGDTTNGVFGPNGSGKSNGIYGAATALTGIPLVGEITDNIREGSDWCRLNLNFSVNGTPCHIVRKWEAKEVVTEEGKKGRGKVTHTVTLKIGEESPVSKPAPVAERLQELFGVPLNAIFDYIFIPQGGMENILFSSAERIDGIGKLIPAVRRAPILLKACTEELAVTPEVIITTTSASVREKLAELQKESEELQSTREAIVSKVASLWWWPEGAVKKQAAAVRATSDLQTKVSNAEAMLADANAAAVSANKAHSALPDAVQLPEVVTDEVYREAVRFSAEFPSKLSRIRELQAEAQAEMDLVEFSDAQAADLSAKEAQQAGEASRAATWSRLTKEKGVIRFPGADLGTLEAGKASLDRDMPALVLQEANFSERAAEAKDRAAVAAAKLSALLKGGEACPTCGKAFDNYAETLKQYEAEDAEARAENEDYAKTWKEASQGLQSAKEALATVTLDIQKYKEAQARQAQIDAELGSLPAPAPAGLAKEIEDLRSRKTAADKCAVALMRRDAAVKALAKMPSVPELEEEHAAVKGVIAAREAYLKDVEAQAAVRSRKDEAFRTLQAALLKAKEAGARVAAASQALADAQKEMDPILPRDPAVIEEAASVRSGVAADLAAMGASLAGMERLLAAENARLSGALEQEAAAEDVMDYRRKLEAIKAACHRDNFPSAVIADFVGRLEDETNRFLAGFVRPFVVKMDGAAEITCSFQSGYECSTRRLSGGQKCALSVAFRFAMAQVFSPELGLLVLDEPTEYLDAENREKMKDVMEYAAQVGVATGMQLIVITHAVELQDVFDHKIELEAA